MTCQFVSEIQRGHRPLILLGVMNGCHASKTLKSFGVLRPSQLNRLDIHIFKASARLSSSKEKNKIQAKRHRAFSVRSMATDAADQSTAPGDLLIVGTGVLGTYLATQWQARGGSVTGRTKTSNNHDKLRSFGIKTETIEEYEDRKYPYVVFSAPPSGSDDYPSAVKASLDFWDKSGSFVFTSSTGVCPKKGHVNEDTPPADPESTLAQAEVHVIEAGGNVARLCGLFHAQRGPQKLYFAKGICKRPSKGEIYMIHYQDAADFVLQILLKGSQFRSQIFLGTPAEPITFQDMVDECKQSGLPLYQGDVSFAEERSEAWPEKQLDNTKTLRLLDYEWASKLTYHSVMTSDDKDWYYKNF